MKKRIQDLINKGNQQENRIEKNTRTTKGTKSCLKMCGKLNSIKMHT